MDFLNNGPEKCDFSGFLFNPMRDWRPSAGLDAIKARAEMLAAVRTFFAQRDVLEVETPLLAPAAGTDPAIEPLETVFTGPGHAHGLPLYLQTSPEFHMKRLLAAGSGPIYQVCKAFRDGEAGPRHNPEFTILEWYRPGFDHHQLMGEVAELVMGCLGCELPVEKRPYRELFLEHYGIDPLEIDQASLRQTAIDHSVPGAVDIALDSVDAWLDLLLTHGIEPELGRGRLTFVTDYPASQAVLARLNPDDPRSAARFELYFDGVELANGFWELTDAAEQRRRFEQENEERSSNGQPTIPVDESFLAALGHGLPECSGVALGLDRVLMLAEEKQQLSAVMAFPLGIA